MMKKQVSRTLAAVLCLVMALSLFVPAMAAVPMMDAAAGVEETAPEEGGTVAHSHGAVVEQRPAVDESEEIPAATLASCCSATAPHTQKDTIDMTKDTGTSSEHYVLFVPDAGGQLIVASNNSSKSDWKVTGDTGCVSAPSKTSINNCKAAKVTVLATGTCTVATSAYSFTLHIVSEAGPACTHPSDKVENVAAVQPTCGVPGAEAGTKCSACGEILSGCKEIPATGAHNWVNGTDTATCVSAGKRTDTCSVCKLTRTVTTTATGKHTYPNGATSGICTVCSYDSSTGGIHTHDWQKTSETPANCTATGSVTSTCSTCHQTKTETTPKAKHTWDGDECSVCHTAKPSSDFNKQAGGREVAYIEWPIADGVGTYKVYVGAVSGGAVSHWTVLDDQLVRQYPGYMRADALGLKPGTYRMKVVADNDESTAMTTGDLEVTAQDRSGFAFANATTTPGVYNADGTLKEGTNVVYITQETASTVTLDVDVSGKGTKTTVTGLPGILMAYKKGKDTTPLCIRIIGTVAHDFSSASTPLKAPYAGKTITGVDQEGNPVDLNNKDFKGDLMIKAVAGPVTIEGVGKDATLYGIGIRVTDTSYVEVRNIGSVLCNSGENDCIGFQPDCSHIWVHNNDLFYGSAGSDKDQVKGDGSLDTKGVKYATLSYNHFWDCGKANLCGLDDNMDYLTYHHNWYDHSDSRHPRIRYSEHTHVYNNYYDGNAKYGVGATTGSCTFVDSNYFRGCKYPMLISMQGTDKVGGGTFSGEAGGMIKAYGNYITGAKAFVDQNQSATDFDAYVVANRTDTVPASCATQSGSYTYNNFDTAESLNIDKNYPVETAAEAQNTVIRQAGRLEGGDLSYSFNNATADASYDIDSTLQQKLYDYRSSLVKVGGTVDSSIQPTEHKHEFGEWSVTTPGDCKTGTAQVETRYCINGACPDNASETRTTAASHSFVNGVCENCSAKESSTGGGTTGGGTGTTGSSQTLKATDFADGTDKTSISDTIGNKCGGYFSLYGDGKTVLRRYSSDTTKAIDFIDIPKGAGAGVQFHTKGAAQVTVKCSSTSKTGKSSTMQLVKVDGTTLTPMPSTAGATSTTVTKNVSDATAVSFKLEAAGTYAVLATTDSPYNLRLTELTVAETQSSGGSGETCAHSTSSWHEVKAATCNASGTKERRCNFCHVVLETVTTEPTEDHDWGESVINDTKTAIVHTCNVCHTEEEVAVIAGALNGEVEIPYAVADDGAVTVLHTIPTGNTIFVAYWNGTKFLGARAAAKDVPTTPVSGWNSIKLIWLDGQRAPQSPAETFTK